MGVDYSFGAGYGVAGTSEDWDGSDLPGKLKGLDWDELQKLELPEGIVLDLGGDMMSGPTRWALLVERTKLRVSKYDAMPVLTRFDGVTVPEAQRLGLALDQLGIEPDFIGWHFFCNVS